MKDEIKEILEYLEIMSSENEPDIELSREEVKLLLDYITNLQCDIDGYKTKYKNAKENLKNLQKENERLSKEVTKYDEILCERNNEVDRLNNIINELENGLKEEIDRLEKVALENKNNKFEFDKLVLIRGKVIDIYDELIYEIYENKWKKIEKE